MAQYARPDSDILQGAWIDSGGDFVLYNDIDETSASDSDNVSTSVSADTFQVGLSNVTDPSSSSNHTIRVRCKKGFLSSGTHYCRLKQGSTTIASFSPSVTTSYATYSYTLSGSEADAITDYTDLRLEYQTGTEFSSSSNVSWMEFEVPDASGTTYYQSATGGITPSGVKLNQSNLMRSGATTPSGVLLRQWQRLLTGAMTSAGAIQRSVAKLLTGALAPVGTAARTFYVYLTGRMW